MRKRWRPFRTVMTGHARHSIDTPLVNIRGQVSVPLLFLLFFYFPPLKFFKSRHLLLRSICFQAGRQVFFLEGCTGRLERKRFLNYCYYHFEVTLHARRTLCFGKVLNKHVFEESFRMPEFVFFSLGFSIRRYCYKIYEGTVGCLCSCK